MIQAACGPDRLRQRLAGPGRIRWASGCTDQLTIEADSIHLDSPVAVPEPFGSDRRSLVGSRGRERS
jgi:hypothetical protein